MTLLAVAGIVAGAAALLMGAAWLAFALSPWPMVMLIRRAPGMSGREIEERLEPLVPHDLWQSLDERYDPDDADGYLDVFAPAHATGALPTIVWVHGGAFVAGSRVGVRNYLRILASRGYTTVAVEYTHAPERRYPTPVAQLDTALAYLHRHAARLRIDPEHIVLAGDSAGAHIAAQTALALTDPDYAARAKLPVKAGTVRVRATILACGPYDLGLPDYNGPYARFLRAVLWAYTGTRKFNSDPRIAYASLPAHVGPAFPPTFITVGNADPLKRHSVALAAALVSQGVHVDTLFFADDHEPAVGHEYQFDVTTPAGAMALERVIAHLQACTSRSSTGGEECR